VLTAGGHSIGKVRDARFPMAEKYMDYTPFTFDQNYVRNIVNLEGDVS
jgi:hypothetical protein